MSGFVTIENKKDITVFDMLFLNSIIAGAVYSLLSLLKIAESIIDVIFKEGTDGIGEKLLSFLENLI